MRIHAIETGKVTIKEVQRRARARAYPLRVGATMLSRAWTEPLPILAWVIEHPEGLIVVDTGETARASGSGYFPAWQPYFRLAVRVEVRPEEEIGPRIAGLGLSAADVRWVVLTHMHTDHAGGLAAFPRAEILVTRTEYRAALGLGGKVAGYLPNRWPSWFTPSLMEHDGPALGGFPASVSLTQAGDVHLVSTAGHTPGHQSVIVNDGDRPVFIAGDVSYTEGLLHDGVLDGVAPRAAIALKTNRVVRDYLAATNAVYLPTHDPESEQRLLARAG